MTITLVGAGTSATASNASVTPVAHASTVAGDLVLVAASIRNSGTGTVNTPTGWTPISGTANLAVFGRIWQTGDAIPAVTFTGGVANADTIGQTVTLRGVEPRLLDAIGASASQLNGSAQNVAYPALDVPGAAHAVVTVAWKQDDGTYGGSPTVSSSVTTGDDASQAIYVTIQTTEADIGASSLTVTGGAAAISRSIVLAIRPAASLVVTEQDVYPPRAVIAVSGLTIGDDLAVYREISGERTLVRGGAPGAVTDPGFVTIDAELPFGVALRYVAVVNGTVEYTSALVTYTLTGGKVALTDAITGQAAEVVIMAMGDLVRARDSARFRVGGRNLVVSGPMGQAEGSHEIYCETTVARDDLMSLLAEATEGIVQVRQSGGYDGVDAYLAVDRTTETRWSQDGSDERRLVTIEFAEVDAWPSTLEARGFTYADLATYYTGLTYADLAGDYATYLDLAQGDFS